MKIRDFMIRNVISVQQDTSVKDLLKLLVKYKIGGVPVVDSENRLKGMISDGDIIRYLQPKAQTVYDMFAFIYVEEGEELQETIAKKLNHPVKKLLKPRRIFVVGPDDDLEKAFQILSKHHFKKIPVVDSNQKVVGVISRGDLVRVITNKLIVDE